MNVIHRRGWEIPDRLATPEHFVFNRRSFVAAGVSALTLSPLGATAQRLSDVAKLPDPSADLYPAKRNENLLDRAITNEKVNGNYNNFYEFGTSKSIASAPDKQAKPILLIAPVRRLPPWPVSSASRRGAAQTHRRPVRASRY